MNLKNVGGDRMLRRPRGPKRAAFCAHGETSLQQRHVAIMRSERTMNFRSRDVGAFVMVGLEREDEAISRITEILEPLGIPIEVVGRGQQLRRTRSVVFRVPHHRVAETLLALELQGFPDVRAYLNVDSPPAASESAARDESDHAM
jgi:hypothetical protein